MFDQSFALLDIPKIFFLAFLEIILSADNAIVLGILASRLPERLRAKALYIGSISAFFIRAVALFILGFLIQYKFVQILGAAYLFYLSLNYLFKNKKKGFSTEEKNSFWKIVILIELFDVVFAIDSILAGVAFISTNDPHLFHSKIWIVYVGGMIGLLAIRYAAHLFSSILKRFPRMELTAHLMIGWIGIKLVYELFPHPAIFEPIFWSVLAFLFCLGLIKRQRKYG
jgi:YkoY family integral membrane protein